VIIVVKQNTGVFKTMFTMCARNWDSTQEILQNLEINYTFFWGMDLLLYWSEHRQEASINTILIVSIIHGDAFVLWWWCYGSTETLQYSNGCYLYSNIVALVHSLSELLLYLWISSNLHKPVEESDSCLWVYLFDIQSVHGSKSVW